MVSRNHDAGERWDESDVQVLLAMANEGYTAAYVAAHLGRTVSAVYSKMYRLRHGK
jgi:hypothetical protein